MPLRLDALQDAKIAGKARHVYVAGHAQRRASKPAGYLSAVPETLLSNRIINEVII